MHRTSNPTEVRVCNTLDTHRAVATPNRAGIALTRFALSKSTSLMVLKMSKPLANAATDAVNIIPSIGKCPVTAIHAPAGAMDKVQPRKKCVIHEMRLTYE